MTTPITRFLRKLLNFYPHHATISRPKLRLNLLLPSKHDSNMLFRNATFPRLFHGFFFLSSFFRILRFSFVQKNIFLRALLQIDPKLRFLKLQDLNTVLELDVSPNVTHYPLRETFEFSANMRSFYTRLLRPWSTFTWHVIQPMGYLEICLRAKIKVGRLFFKKSPDRGIPPPHPQVRRENRNKKRNLCRS